MKCLLAAGLGGLSFASEGLAGETATIVTPQQPARLLVLAGRETMRYLYLRTGHLLPILAADRAAVSGDEVVIATKGSPLLSSLALDPGTRAEVAGLVSQQYVLKTIAGRQKGKTLLIVGGDEIGALYGVYHFVEELGVRFYLHGDTIPDARIPFALPDLDEIGKPLFSLRGIQPFHDFPEGPDWWNRDDYLACIAQLPKLRMNFIGFHTYPYSIAEPGVWIGLSSDLAPDGKVTFSYPSTWANTQRTSWGYHAGPTSGFSCGASELFPTDIYGPDVMEGMMPTPITPEQSNELFNRVGGLFHEAFAEAKALGVKTCVGTEAPLTIPPLVAVHLKQAGKDPNSLATRKELYEGIFRRIAMVYPADYYWLWTPETWTWKGNTSEQFAKTTDDLQAAMDAMKEEEHPFQLATCGWVLGPKDNRAALDAFLPKDMPMSSISRDVGNYPLDLAYAQITDRPTWAIPWLENDGVLTSPEPWVGRMLCDAADARRLGCSGLFGIHWRTKILEANIAALASAGWDQSYVPADFETALPANPPRSPDAEFPRIPGRDLKRSLDADAFYADFATANFGPEVGAAAGKIMATEDGDAMLKPSAWAGPGALTINPEPWEEIRARYAFVDQFAALRPQVVGAGNLDRFDYWLDTYRCLQATAHACCIRGRLDAAMAKVTAATDPSEKKVLTTQALELRLSLTQYWNQLMNFQVATVSTPGELGTIANLELHSRLGHFLDADDLKLKEALGTPLPDGVRPAMAYQGPFRIIVPTVRGQIKPGEPLHLRVFLLGIQPPAQLFWRPLGQGAFNSLPLTLKARSVYEVTLPAMPATTTAFEYYLEAKAGDSVLRYPVTAPALNQTVVVWQ